MDIDVDLKVALPYVTERGGLGEERLVVVVRDGGLENDVERRLLRIRDAHDTLEPLAAQPRAVGGVHESTE